MSVLENIRKEIQEKSFTNPDGTEVIDILVAMDVITNHLNKVYDSDNTPELRDPNICKE